MKPIDAAAEWSPEIAEAVAAEEGIVLTAEHWRAITCWREIAARSESIPWLANLAACGISLSKLNELFPERPRAILSRLGGVPE